MRMMGLKKTSVNSGNWFQKENAEKLPEGKDRSRTEARQ